MNPGAYPPVARPQALRGYGPALACLLFGAAAVLAFAPFRAWPVAVVSLTGLAWFLDRAPTARRAAVIGFCFGLGYFLTGVSWVYVSMHDFGGMAVPIAAFATAFFCSYLALFPAAAGWLTQRLPGDTRLAPGLVVPRQLGLGGVVTQLGIHGFPLARRGLFSISTGVRCQAMQRYSASMASHSQSR